MPRDTPANLDERRCFYARLITSQVNQVDAQLVAAFAKAPRENFLPPGPWLIPSLNGSFLTPSDDPRYIYSDCLVAFDHERHLNNGNPSLHARALTACRVRKGDVVLHVGAGSGYYTAIIAEMVGGEGHVTAYEVDPQLHAFSASSLRSYPQVEAVLGSAVRQFNPQFDLIYVCAGATHVPQQWIEALKVGAKLMLPLTPDRGPGALLLLEKLSADQCRASFFWHSTFYPCIGARDERRERALAVAMADPACWRVQSYRRDAPPDRSCWLEEGEWWFSTDALACTGVVTPARTKAAPTELR